MKLDWISRKVGGGGSDEKSLLGGRYMYGSFLEPHIRKVKLRVTMADASFDKHAKKLTQHFLNPGIVRNKSTKIFQQD